MKKRRVRKSVNPIKRKSLIIERPVVRLGRRKFASARSAARDLDRAIFATGPGRTNSVGPEDLDRIDREFKRIRSVRG